MFWDLQYRMLLSQGKGGDIGIQELATDFNSFGKVQYYFKKGATQ